MDLNINYKKLAKAHTYLQKKSTLYIATNGDLTYPCKGSTFPGTGSLIASLSASTGRQPTFIGKPNQAMMDVIVDKFKLDRSRTIMVGDRLDTDILFGNKGGCKTLCVLTGVTTQSDLESTDIIPTYVADSLADIIRFKT
jgi:4-nitrophenyl phosphatase